MKYLTLKQEAFVREFMIDRCAAAAARRAGYSENTAKSKGHTLVNLPHVKAEIDRLRNESAERLGCDADSVIERLNLIADQWQESPSSACRALELLAKHLGLFEKDNKQSQSQVGVYTPINIVLSREIAAKQGVDDDDLQPKVV